MELQLFESDDDEIIEIGVSFENFKRLLYNPDLIRNIVNIHLNDSNMIIIYDMDDVTEFFIELDMNIVTVRDNDAIYCGSYLWNGYNDKDIDQFIYDIKQSLIIRDNDAEKYF